MAVAVSMVLALCMILFGAELFTNAVEWLGKKLHLGQGAVGSVLAALGTALPETAVPVTAILLGQGNTRAEDVGIGGILGAPFLLVTLGSLIVALSMMFLRKGASRKDQLMIEPRAFQRDMSFFLVAYAFTLVVGCVPNEPLHRTAPYALLGLYVIFLGFTLKDKSSALHLTEIHPLYLQWKHAHCPRISAVALQLLVALIAIVGGAHLLSGGVERIALRFDIPPFVLSAILIPLATELPETFNSVVWIRQGKDALAIGNITGAMVFQSTLVPALGIGLTHWMLRPDALLTGGLTLAAGGLIYGVFRLRGAIAPGVLVSVSLLYWVLPLQAIAKRYALWELYWGSVAVLLVLFVLSFRAGLHVRSA